MRWLILRLSPALGLKCSNPFEDKRSFELQEVVRTLFGEVHLHHQLLFIQRYSGQHVVHRWEDNMRESLGTWLGRLRRSRVHLRLASLLRLLLLLGLTLRLLLRGVVTLLHSWRHGRRDLWGSLRLRSRRRLGKSALLLILCILLL